MSELNSGKIKITNDGNIIMQFSNYHHVIDSDTELYYKHQADKVIAEKDKEIAELKAQVHDYAQGLYVIQARAEKEARRHKYNRCLLRSVIAEMNATHFKDLFYGAGSEALADEYNKQVTIHYKWQKRWLALAEKFKEAK